VERCIGSVKQVVYKLLHGTDAYWPLFLPFAQLTFNSKISALTGSAPFVLFFNRPVNTLNDYSKSVPVSINVGLDDWKEQQEKMIALIYPSIRTRISENKTKMVERLDASRRLLVEKAIVAGTCVMLKDQLKGDKYGPNYVGPYFVVRRTRAGTYVLRDSTGDILDRRVPIDQLHALPKRREHILQRDKETSYAVERVIGHRGDVAHREYRVKWKGFDESWDTWEPAKNFQDTQCIRDYWNRVGLVT
jgi:hypothetical protein